MISTFGWVLSYHCDLNILSGPTNHSCQPFIEEPMCNDLKNNMFKELGEGETHKNPSCRMVRLVRMWSYNKHGSSRVEQKSRTYKSGLHSWDCVSIVTIVIVP